VLSEGFSFGDGSSAAGVSATHAYGAPGSYQVTASSTDVLGNTTTVTRTVTIGSPPIAALPAAGTTRCTLTAAHTQKLLGKGKVTAAIDCGASIVIALDGHLTVRVPRAQDSAHGKGARTTLYNYTLKSTHVSVQAGRLDEVRLTLSPNSLRGVLGALSQHRQVGLYLTLASVKGAMPATQTQTHRTSIVLARSHR
jgi:hypothetical protein